MFVLSLHSILRWLVLLFALLVIVQSVGGMGGSKAFTPANKRNALFLLISCDLQLLLGLYLFFANSWNNVLTSGGDVMKNAGLRFYAVEHWVGMLVAIVLVHIGYSNAKKDIPQGTKHKRLFWFTLIALIIIIATIPWPMREAVGRPWIRI